jgi:hypothetical protein
LGKVIDLPKILSQRGVTRITNTCPRRVPFTKIGIGLEQKLPSFSLEFEFGSGVVAEEVGIAAVAAEHLGGLVAGLGEDGVVAGAAADGLGDHAGAERVGAEVAFGEAGAATGAFDDIPDGLARERPGGEVSAAIEAQK